MVKHGFLEINLFPYGTFSLLWINGNFKKCFYQKLKINYVSK